MVRNSSTKDLRVLFSELAADILLSIFACCDISSVVSIGQTCRYLHNLAFHRSVWLVLVQDLKRRAIVDSALELQDLSAVQLINLVKALLTGPKTWSPRESGLASEVARELVLRLENRVPGISHGDTRLLPSGRYVLFKSWQTLECWNVADSRVVWKHGSTLEHASVAAFAADEIEQNSLVVMICERTFDVDPDDRKNFLGIIHVDLIKGTHDVLLFIRTPNTPYDNAFHDPVICGPLAAVNISGSINTHLIFDWKAQSAFIAVGCPGYSSLIALIPGHVVLKVASSDEEEQLHVISNTALPTHPISATGITASVSWDRIPKLSTLDDLDARDDWGKFYQLTVHASPIRDGDYRIWLHNAANSADTNFYGPVWSYQLSLPIYGPPQWRRRPPGRAPGPHEIYYHAVTYSGHMLIYARPRSLIIHANTLFECEVGFELSGQGKSITLCEPLLFQSQVVLAPHVQARNWISTTHNLHFTAYRLTELANSAHASSVRTWYWVGSSALGDLVDRFPQIINIRILQDTWFRVVKIFTTTLGAYQRLVSLYLDGLRIDTEFRATLDSLTRLQELSLLNCEIVARTGALLPLRRFELQVQGPTPSELDELHIVAPDELQSLILDGSSEGARLLSALFIHSLPRLVDLTITLPEDIVFHLLGRVPLLASLIIKNWSIPSSMTVPDKLLETTIPALTAFRGPDTLAGLLVYGRPVVDITLQGFASATDAEILDASAPLTSLEIQPQLRPEFVPELFAVIGSLFPSLRELSVGLSQPPPSSDDDADQDDQGVPDEEEDEDMYQEEAVVDDRMVELYEGSVDAASETFDVDYQNEEPPAAPTVELPGHLYIPSEPACPPVFDEAQMLPSSDPLWTVMAMIYTSRALLPPRLEALHLTQIFVFPLAQQHRAILALERLLPALTQIRVGGHGSWIHTGSVWQRQFYSSLRIISQTYKFLTRGFYKIVWLKVWIALLDDLKRALMLDSSLDLEDLSTDDLVKVMKALLTGPERSRVSSNVATPYFSQQLTKVNPDGPPITFRAGFSTTGTIGSLPTPPTPSGLGGRSVLQIPFGSFDTEIIKNTPQDMDAASATSGPRELLELWAMHERILILSNEDDWRPQCLNVLGELCLAAHHATQAIDVLTQGICAYADAVRDDPEDSIYRGNLAVALRYRFERLGNLSDIDESVLMATQAVEFTPDSDLNKPVHLNSLGNSLLCRFERLADLDDINKSVLVFQQAVTLTPDNDHNKPIQFNGLGSSLLRRFERLRDLDDIDESIMMYKHAVEIAPDGHPNRRAWLNNLGHSLLCRFERLGNLDDINESVSVAQQAVEPTPYNHPLKHAWLNNLGNSLLARFERLEEIDDLDMSVSVCDQAVKLTPDGHPDKPGRFSTLGNTLRARFERLGEISDIHKSVSLFQQAVELTPNGDWNKPGRLNNLGYSFRCRFDRFGDLSDINKSILMFQQAVELTADGHPEQPAWLNNLGTSLCCRFDWLGDLDDINEAVAMSQRAVELTVDGQLEKPVWLTNLGILCFVALELTSDNHPNKAKLATNLGNSLRVCFHHLEELDDINTSVLMFQKAVELAPEDGHPDKPARLTNLGNSLQDRFDELGDLEDINNSVARFYHAVQLTPNDHPNKVVQCNSLGSSLLRRWERLRNPMDLNQLIAQFKFAALSSTGSASFRFQAASSWAETLRFQVASMAVEGQSFHHRSLLHAYSVAINLLPELAWLGLSISDRYYRILKAGNLVRAAAAAAITAGQYLLAVEWLEQGRSIIWAQMFSLRTPVDALREVYPELADKLMALSVELDGAGTRRSPLEDNSVNGTSETFSQPHSDITKMPWHERGS
ncbi:hypothetical protein FB451DRAFT_1565910 [Mycena latifolia]|nr:hypothetical protein FB451DRAFT_1565910 [Mycena latifolia]